MKFIFSLTLFVASVSFAGPIPTETFSGNVRGDANAYCRVNWVAVQFVEKEKRAYELRWLEKGNYSPPQSGPCMNKLTAQLLPIAPAPEPLSFLQWTVQFDFYPNDLNSWANFAVDQLLFNLDAKFVTDEGNEIPIQAKMLFKPEQKSLTYWRGVKPLVDPRTEISGSLVSSTDSNPFK